VAFKSFPIAYQKLLGDFIFHFLNTPVGLQKFDCFFRDLKMHGLFRKNSQAVGKHPDMRPAIVVIDQEGGKVTSIVAANGRGKRITFCPQEGPGERTVIIYQAGDKVPAAEIRRALKSVGDDVAARLKPKGRGKPKPSPKFTSAAARP
jgi:hypothetical protein